MKIDPRREFENLSSSIFESGYTTSGVDAYRDADTYVVEFELPGVDPAEVEVTVHSGVLSVTADRKIPELGEVQRILMGRSRGRYTRSVRLGNYLDTDAVSATYDAGVLVVKVPVLASSKPRRVPVERATSQNPTSGE